MDFRIIFSAAYLFTSAFSMDNTVHLEPYNREWHRAFLIEQMSLDYAFTRGFVKSIEHVGSTSIEGMHAKPVIDILIGTDGDELIQDDFDTLASMGYEFIERSAYCDRYYFKKIATHVSFNLSVTTYMGLTWKKMIYFRNYLRENQAARERYLAVKLEALMKGFNTLPAYSAYKRNVIIELERESFLYAQERL